MRRFISSVLSLLIIISCFSITTFANNVDEFMNDNMGLSLEINSHAEEIQLTDSTIEKLPKPMNDYIKENPELKLISTNIQHFTLEKNELGQTEKTLIRSFEIRNESDMIEYTDYIKAVESNDIGIMSQPRIGEEIIVGISCWAFSDPSPTAYQIQGWWEWKPAALGVFTAGHDVVGLNFQGQTEGSNYNSLANNIWNHLNIQLNLLNSDDNGVAYSHQSSSSLSYGAVLGEVRSDKEIKTDTFEVSFIYEHFESNPNPTYLEQLVWSIIDAGLPWLPPLPSQNARFPSSQNLYYGNNISW